MLLQHLEEIVNENIFKYNPHHTLQPEIRTKGLMVSTGTLGCACDEQTEVVAGGGFPRSQTSLQVDVRRTGVPRWRAEEQALWKSGDYVLMQCSAVGANQHDVFCHAPQLDTHGETRRIDHRSLVSDIFSCVMNTILLVVGTEGIYNIYICMYSARIRSEEIVWR